LFGKVLSMKNWMWTRTALSVLALGLISVGAGCQDAKAPATTESPAAPATTDTPAPEKAAGGSGLHGGVDVPPPVQPEAADKPAAEAKPADEAKPAEDAKPVEEAKPAAEAKPAE
jgi:hypothetical protein